MKKSKKRVLILCTGNSCRSQMGEGIAKSLFSDQFDIVSAGTQPSFVHPLAIKVMNEIGMDISAYRSKSVHEFKEQSVDFVITVCSDANEKCPMVLAPAKKNHWGFEDPATAQGTEEDVLNKFREVRDSILSKFRASWLQTLSH